MLVLSTYVNRLCSTLTACNSILLGKIVYKSSSINLGTKQTINVSTLPGGLFFVTVLQIAPQSLKNCDRTVVFSVSALT